MELQPDIILKKGKSNSLPLSLNFARIINKLPFSVGIEVNHDKFLQPTITLLPVAPEKERLRR